MEASRNYKDYHYIYQNVQQQDALSVSTASSLLPFARTSSGASSEPETSFDSGYFSPSQPNNFTALTSQPRGTHHIHRSPVKTSSSVVNDLMGRSHWSDDLGAGVADDWEKNLLEVFEENLFGLDASDLNSLAEGIFQSPFKSPRHSPYKSPRHGPSALSNLSVSPFKNASPAGPMLPVSKRSPVRLGGSPFKSPFSSPSLSSPRRVGLGSSTYRSPLTRQRRLILQSPDHKENAANPMATNFLDIPSDLLEDIKEDIGDDLEAVPFQRQNSFGFLPDNNSPLSSPPYSEAYSGAQSFYEEENHHCNLPLQSSVKEQPYDQTDMSGLVEDGKDPLGNVLHKKAPSTQTKKSLANPNQISAMPSRDVLQFMRARFRQVLDKAVEDMKVREQGEKTGLKRTAENYETTKDAVKPWQGDDCNAHVYTELHRFAGSYSQRPSGKKRLEIRPKPEMGLPVKEPCMIPLKNLKKRKH